MHRGVYLVGAGEVDWHQRVLAAVLAAGDGAAASHRAAVILWGLDGIGSAPVEVTVPLRSSPELAGVIVHRSGRPFAVERRERVPVTDVKRTLLDAAGCLPPVVMAKAFESAYRQRLVTPRGLQRYLAALPGCGVDGFNALRAYLDRRTPGLAAGSGAEVEVIELLQAWGIEPPVRQHRIHLGNDAVATVDLAWPHLRKAVEVQGFEAHASPAAIEADADRANAIQDAGWELRCYSGRTASRDPVGLAARIRRFLETEPHPKTS